MHTFDLVLNGSKRLKKNPPFLFGINEIETDKKEIRSSTCDILGEMCNFYEKLYNSNSIPDNEINSYLDDCEIKHLTENDKKCVIVFQHLKNVKMQ